MSVYKRSGSPFWQVNIYRGPHVPRLRMSTGETDHALAVEIANVMRQAQRCVLRRDILVAAIDDLTGHQNGNGVLIEKAWSVYESLPEVKMAASTRKARFSRWTAFARYIAKEWPLVRHMHEVTRDVAFAFYDWMRPQCATGKSWNHIKGDVQAVFSALMFRAGIEENVWKLVPRADTSDSKHGRAFTQEEQDRIMLACLKAGNDWQDVCLVALYTGLRHGDIQRLRWDCIREDRIVLRPSKTERYEIDATIPMHRKLREVFDSRHRAGQYVFPGQAADAGRSFSVQPFTRIWRAAKIETKGAKISFHCWRHTFRTRLAQAGVSKDVAQKLGGWSTDISELYNHDYDSLSRAIAALG